MPPGRKPSQYAEDGAATARMEAGASGLPEKLPPAQTRLLLEAYREYPKPVAIRPRSTGAAARLFSKGLFLAAGPADEHSYRLSKAGIELATQMSAQHVIDAVNERRVASSRPHTPKAPDSQGAPGAPPANWPFPVSGHGW